MLNGTGSLNEHLKNEQRTSNTQVQTLCYNSGKHIRRNVAVKGKKLGVLISENGKYLRCLSGKSRMLGGSHAYPI